LYLNLLNFNFDFRNCKSNSNSITCENYNRWVETYVAYVVEDSLKMANKSGRNMLENKLIIESYCAAS